MPGKKLNGFSRTPAGVFVNCEGNSIAPRSLSPWRTQLPIFKTSARGGVEDGVCVEAVDAIEVRQVAGLAEMIDTQRVHAMARHDPARPLNRRLRSTILLGRQGGTQMRNQPDQARGSVNVPANQETAATLAAKYVSVIGSGASIGAFAGQGELSRPPPAPLTITSRAAERPLSRDRRSESLVLNAQIRLVF